MRRRAEKIDMDNLIVIAEQLIPETKPKTFMGKVFRVIDKILKLKILLGIKIK